MFYKNQFEVTHKAFIYEGNTQEGNVNRKQRV